MDKKLYSDKDVETQTEKCPSCGGTLIFSPNHGKLKCEYCGSMVDFEKQAGIIENEIDALFDRSNEWTETEVYRCNNCGAKEIVSKTEISKLCAFCGTTNVIKTEELSGIKPHGVVPFRLTSEESAAVAKRWLSKRYFAPNAFKKSALPQNIHGVYNPVFTFDSNTFSTYNGRLGQYYYETRRVGDRTVTDRKTRYFNVSGQHQIKFDDLLVQGSEKITQQTLNVIEPFPTNQSQKYNSKFMTGFVANQYTKDGKVCYTQAKQLMDARIRHAILAKHRHDTVDYLRVNTAFSDVTFKYVLLPIYIGHTMFKNKLYNFYVNGHNGKITGKTPVSVWKVLMVVLLVLGIMAAVMLLPILLGVGVEVLS